MAGKGDTLVWRCLNLLFSAASFLFDIFLGHSYNHMPPSVKFMTVGCFDAHISRAALKLAHDFQTNGGKFRFNPNLYAVRAKHL